MGDRGNIVVLQQGYSKDGKIDGFDQVWFYSHWGGSGLPEDLRNTLARKERWDDDVYLARMIFCEMVSNGDNLKGSTGLGISCRITDNEHKILVVDVPNQKVGIIAENDLDNGCVPAGYNAGQWTFEEFSALTNDNLPKT